MPVTSGPQRKAAAKASTCTDTHSTKVNFEDFADDNIVLYNLALLDKTFVGKTWSEVTSWPAFRDLKGHIKNRNCWSTHRPKEGQASIRAPKALLCVKRAFDLAKKNGRSDGPFKAKLFSMSCEPNGTITGIPSQVDSSMDGYTFYDAKARRVELDAEAMRKLKEESPLSLDERLEFLIQWLSRNSTTLEDHTIQINSQVERLKEHRGQMNELEKSVQSLENIVFNKSEGGQGVQTSATSDDDKESAREEDGEESSESDGGGGRNGDW